MPQNMQYVWTDGAQDELQYYSRCSRRRAQLGSDLAMAFVANANYTHVNYELRSVLKSMRILNVTKCITFIDEIEKVACQ